VKRVQASEGRQRIGRSMAAAQQGAAPDRAPNVGPALKRLARCRLRRLRSRRRDTRGQVSAKGVGWTRTRASRKPTAKERLRAFSIAGLGYTAGMKTAVSIPDEVFEKVERLARRARKSRSEVFSAALREYVARHAPDEVTESINQVCDRIREQDDPFVRTAARRILKKPEW